jgi:hypothetical protein
MIKEAMADLVPFEDKTFLFLFVLFSFKIVNQPPLLLFLSRRTALLRAFGALLNKIPISGQTLSPSQGGPLLWLASRSSSLRIDILITLVVLILSKDHPSTSLNLSSLHITDESVGAHSGYSTRDRKDSNASMAISKQRPNSMSLTCTHLHAKIQRESPRKGTRSISSYFEIFSSSGIALPVQELE